MEAVSGKPASVDVAVADVQVHRIATPGSHCCYSDLRKRGWGVVPNVALQVSSGNTSL